MHISTTVDTFCSKLEKAQTSLTLKFHRKKSSGKGGTAELMCLRKILKRTDVSTTPMFLFISGDTINEIAQNKHPKIPNHQEE